MFCGIKPEKQHCNQQAACHSQDNVPFAAREGDNGKENIKEYTAAQITRQE